VTKEVEDMKFELTPLPWDPGALEPYLSAHTIDVHYNRHHRGYLEKLEKAIGDSELADLDLIEIIRRTDGSTFNWAAQVWNHDFYWQSMRPRGGGNPTGALAEALVASFGSIDHFRKEFAKAAESEFGSGWAWLVQHPGGDLRVVSTDDAENPVQDGRLTPLLTIDVWEHAYYLDYENERGKYIDAFLTHLVNWQFAQDNLARETTGNRARRAS
jgi:Fe-Mn family superoxide dismutase